MTVPPVLTQKHFSFPYKPDGAVPLAGLFLTALFAFGAALVIGAVVGFADRWIYLVVLFPALMGSGVGFAGRKGLKVGKVRNAWVAGGLGLSAGLLVMLISYYASYLVAVRELSQEIPAAEAQELVFSFSAFLEFMDLYAKQGVTIIRLGHGKGMNLGYVGSYLYWVGEILLAAGAAWLIMKRSIHEPFCTTCHSWKPGDALGTATIRQELLDEIMKAGDLPRLVERLQEGSTMGSKVLFTAYACPDCLDQSTVEIRLQEMRLDSKGRNELHDVGTWSFTADALPAWKNVFAAEG